jgi:hypothetical protein
MGRKEFHMKLNTYLAETYLDAVLSDIDAYTVKTIEELGRVFEGLREKRPTIYTDFLRWIENLVSTGCLIPLA